MSGKMKGKKLSSEYVEILKNKIIKTHGRPVLVYDKNWVFIKEFASKSLTAEGLGISLSPIKLILAGKRKKPFIYNFKYK